MLNIVRLLAMLCVASAILLAQEARLLGTVTDPSGAVVPGVAITATETTHNISFTAKSSSEGLYLFPRLPIGPYDVKAEFSGFIAPIRRLHDDQRRCLVEFQHAGGQPSRGNLGFCSDQPG